MGFAKELKNELSKVPKIGGKINLAAAVGMGANPEHAERSLLEAKNKLGPIVGGKRQNIHAPGDAPTTIHSDYAESLLNQPQLKNPLGKSIQDLFHPISGHPIFNGGCVGIISANDIDLLKHEITDDGLDFIELETKYNKLEKSLAVINPTEEYIKQLGKKFNQETVIYSNDGIHKLIYINGPNVGKLHKGEGINLLNDTPTDFYTKLEYKGNSIYFNYPFDFNLGS
ncbi:MAG: hypothetical protein KGO96_07695 [Elusimicrobia bacterium]|nr:hypothetical protein [Elusimicrobiota bacterium]